MTHSKHSDSALSLQSAEEKKKKRFWHLQQSRLMNHQRWGNQSELAGGEAAKNENLGCFQSAGCSEATHCRLCQHADIILFPTKTAWETRGQRRVYVLPVSIQCCPASKMSLVTSRKSNAHSKFHSSSEHAVLTRGTPASCWVLVHLSQQALPLHHQLPLQDIFICHFFLFCAPWINITPAALRR